MNSQAILSIENLSIAFGGLKAVDDLSFHINEKEIYGLIGPNGAGKTTVFNCITQFYKADHGSVWFESMHKGRVNLMNFPVHEIIELGLVRTFQNVELIQELSILDNVLIGAHSGLKATLIEQAFRLPRARHEEKRMTEKAMSILESLGIHHLSTSLVAGQPYGILKKVELARTLIGEPKLIILDEPAAGLNDTETLELAKRIRMIRDTYHCTILLVEHDMRLVMDVCDRICAISFGKKLAEGTKDVIKAHPKVQEAYLGMEVEAADESIDE